MKPKLRYIITSCWLVATLLFSVMAEFVTMNSVYRLSPHLVNPFSWFLHAGTTLLWFGAVPLLGYFIVMEFRERERRLWIRSGIIGINLCLLILYTSASFGWIVSGTFMAFRDIKDEVGNRVKYNMLLEAMKTENLDKVQTLLDDTPELLEVSNRFGHTPLHSAAATGKAGAVRKLLQYSPAVDARAWFGWTPLHSAAKFGRTDVVTQLLDYGCDPNVKSERDRTPLHMAAAKGHLSTVKLLVKGGANVNAVTQAGATPRSLALRENHHNVDNYLKAQGGEEKVSPTGTNAENPAEKKKGLFDLY